MDIFVNRESELKMIDDSFVDLIGQKRLLRNPIIEVQGISGIGKTSLLRQIESRCRATSLRYIWVDISHNPEDVSREILEGIQRHFQDIQAGNELSPVRATQTLLDRGPVVVLLDSVDSAYGKQLAVIESFLQELIDNERLFVVLASKKEISFQQRRAVARKLTRLPLKPLSRLHCDIYLSQSVAAMKPEVSSLIYEWTQGYPLAMRVAIEAVEQGSDPQTDKGRAEIFARLDKQVLTQEILSSVPPSEQRRYHFLLQLLAVPRRFNLIILQDLIEAFYQEEKRESSMGYFSLPRDINDLTGILNWNMVRGGFSINEPVRALLLLLLKEAQPEQYLAIHTFLAQTNLQLARTLSGLDRARAVRECLYHLSCSVQSVELAERLEEPMQVIFRESPDAVLQFSEEFAQDSELARALGDYLVNVQNRINEQLEVLKDEDA